jgi:endoglucanase
MEAIHWRDGSDHGLIDGCNIRSTGKVDPGKGEGIYIGSSSGSWDDFDHHVTHVTIRNCILGPIIRSEAIDVKEGTEHITIENNTFDATGLSNQNFADSFIDLKGARAIVRYNIFRRNGETNLLKGINVIARGVVFSAYEHVIHDNYFDLDGTSLKMVIANGGTSDVYAWNNHREPNGPTGNKYSSSVITNNNPPWYSPPVPSAFPIDVHQTIPTSAPTITTTMSPSAAPVTKPTSAPTITASMSPSAAPVTKPTSAPTIMYRM